MDIRLSRWVDKRAPRRAWAGRIARPRVLWLGVALQAIACAATVAWAQPAQDKARPVPQAVIDAPLPPLDSMASRVLACTACHGAQGRATPDGYFPRIAGKPEGYLYRQLLNFQEGRRQYPAMARLIEFLPHDYLRDMASHFAQLQLPYPPPVTPVQAPAVLARGEQLVRQGDAARRLPACVACHGQQLTGVAPDIPGLLGLSPDYLNSQIGAWKGGQRRAQAPDCMADISAMLGAEDVVAITAWLAAQPVPVDSAPAKALPGALPMHCGAVGKPVAGGAS